MIFYEKSNMTFHISYYESKIHFVYKIIVPSFPWFFLNNFKKCLY